MEKDNGALLAVLAERIIRRLFAVNGVLAAAVCGLTVLCVRRRS